MEAFYPQPGEKFQRRGNPEKNQGEEQPCFPRGQKAFFRQIFGFENREKPEALSA